MRECLDEIVRLHFDLDGAARQARVLELLHQVGLDERHAERLPAGMSGGAAAAGRDRPRPRLPSPSVLILDEAVASLDVSVQAQVLNLLADIREQTGVTYLFISHDLAVVRQVSDEVVVMRRGHDRRARTDRARARPPRTPLHPGAALGGASPGLEARARPANEEK